MALSIYFYIAGVVFLVAVILLVIVRMKKQTNGIEGIKGLEINIRENMKISELVEEMKDIGFGARKIGEASDVLRKMIEENSLSLR